LIDGNAVVVVSGYGRDYDEEHEDFRSRILPIKQIHRRIDLENEPWTLNHNGVPVSPVDAKRYRVFSSIRAYVVADGLPMKIRRAIGESKEVIAEDLIEKIVSRASATKSR
jgi:hypothetical protein